jgi:hypothetical protein
MVFESKGVGRKGENLTKEEVWARAYDVGFSDGFQAGACDGWAEGYSAAEALLAGVLQ